MVLGTPWLCSLGLRSSCFALSQFVPVSQKVLGVVPVVCWAPNLPGHTHIYPGHTWAPSVPPWLCGCAHGHSGLMREVRLMLDPRPPSSRHPEHHRAPSAWGPLRGHHTLPGTHRGVCVGGLPALNPRPGAQGTPRGPLPSRGVTYSLTPPCSAAAKPRGLHGCHDNAGNSHRKPCREEEEKEEEENEGELPGRHPRSVPSSFGMMPQWLLWLFQHLRARGTRPGPALAPQEYPDPWEHKLWCSPPWQGVLEGLQP